MSRRLREDRLRQLLEHVHARVLHDIARSAGAAVHLNTKKPDLIDELLALPEAVLASGLAERVAMPDLRALCARVGHAGTGRKADLVARILAAVDEPAVKLARWRPFAEARAYARSLQLRGQSEWRAFCRGGLLGKGARPPDVPRTPHLVYADDWQSWGDFLGTGNPARHLMAYRPFERARAFVRSLGFSNFTEWRAYCSKRIGNRRVLPADIPAAPHSVYRGKGWVSYGDWLGTGHVHPAKARFRSYRQARAFVRALGIRTETEWRAYCRGEIHRASLRPPDIPTNPSRNYRGRGWVSWGEFLGTDAVAPTKVSFRSFHAARAYMRKQRLANNHDWRAWCAAGKRPGDIPAAPDAAYRGKGWQGWGDFLGTGNLHPARIQWLSLREAQAIVRGLGIRRRIEFVRARQAGRLPRTIPLTIENRPGWPGWDAFLGIPKGRGSDARRSADLD